MSREEILIEIRTKLGHKYYDDRNKTEYEIVSDYVEFMREKAENEYKDKALWI